MDRTAYLDEAFSAGPSGVYVVAAVLVPPSRADGLRFDLRQLLHGRRRRFHWHHEDDADRKRMLEFIADADLAALTVSTCLTDLRAQERARGLGIERILWELRPMRVNHLILEARQERNDQRDRRRILAAQASGQASGDLTYEFGLPRSEPLLWVADAVASVVLASQSGLHRSMSAIIEHAVRRIRL